jgi:hypothetical protein
MAGVALLQVWLQEFAWTEDEKAAKIERRSRDGPKGRELAGEPMFCFEFGMNMLYWSALVYNYAEVRLCSYLHFCSCRQVGSGRALPIPLRLVTASLPVMGLDEHGSGLQGDDKTLSLEKAMKMWTPSC